MRIRSIKPEFFEDEELSALPPFARLLFIGTWLMADKNGVLENRPRLIQAKVFPYDSSGSSDVSRLIPQLIQGGFLVPFEADGKPWLWIPTFKRHQRITGTESTNESRNPLPPAEIPERKQSGNNEEALGMNGAGKGKGSLERERERRGQFVPPTPAEVQGYMDSRKEYIDAEAFCDYWTGQGWKRKGGPMLDWQSTARNWFRRMRPEEHADLASKRARAEAETKRANETAEHHRLKMEADAMNVRIEALIAAPTPEMLERAEAYAAGATARLSQEMRLKMAAADIIEGEGA
jgi:hypothetical protein